MVNTTYVQLLIHLIYGWGFGVKNALGQLPNTPAPNKRYAMATKIAVSNGPVSRSKQSAYCRTSPGTSSRGTLVEAA